MDHRLHPRGWKKFNNFEQKNQISNRHLRQLVRVNYLRFLLGARKEAALQTIYTNDVYS